MLRYLAGIRWLSAAALVCAALGVGGDALAQALPAPTGVETHAPASGQISVSWNATPGATSYNIYRSTTSGGEGATPYATTTSTSYLDTAVTNGPPPVYYYTVAAVNSGGVSPQSAEGATPTPTPMSPGSGMVPGTAVPGGFTYYGKDALLNGFDWFVALNGWFPQVLGSSGASTPTKTVVDMAYASAGTMQFGNVVVPTSGLYNLDVRYAFASGLFPGVTNREMGVSVNGTVITSNMRFPVTGSFETYQDSTIQASLNAGQNTVVLFAVTDHGVSRVDELTVTPAAASAPAGPTNLTATSTDATVSLSWTASTGATAYNIYRGTKFDGESLTPVGTTDGSTTSFTDTGLTDGTTYFYNVAATNSVGISPDSNQLSVTPTPPTHLGWVATASNTGGTDVPAKALDGNVATRWSTGAPMANGMWFEVDMLAAQTFNQITMNSGGNTNDYARGYQVFVSNDGTNFGSAIASGTGTSAFITVPFLTQRARYVKVVQTSAATSWWSIAEFNVLSSAPPPPPPQAASGLTAVAGGSSSTNLSWAASPTSGVTYNAFRSTTAAFTPSTSNQIASGIAGLSYADSGLAASTTYYYYVEAVNAGGASSPSNEANDTTAAPPPPPQPPSGLTAAAASSSSIILSWTASPTSVVTYNVFRSMTASFMPSTSNQVASGVAGVTFTDTALTGSTTFYYYVEAGNSGGLSSPSNEGNATTSAGCNCGVQINAGGPAMAPFAGDEDFAGGGTINHANTIDLSGVTNPAPMAVYQSARTGNFTYTVPGFGPGSSHTIRLHFAETYFATKGSRVFNVSVNGTQVLTNFDIFAAAGAKNKAVLEAFTQNANTGGAYVIQFTSVVNNSLASGIEIQ